jgi:hypothetical protein
MLVLSMTVPVSAAIPTMPVSELKPGMKGVGRSVFSGQAVEEFGVEVIDVMHQVWPRGDLILCRLSGHGLEESGVIAGMSGSPVYINGRLVGAVAYAWGFAKEPLAGVTPISQMLDVWNQEQAEHGAESRSRLSLPPGSSAGFSPLPLPVAVSGLTPQLSELIAPALRPYNLMPVAAAGRAPFAGAADTMLVPGAAVGVALTDGDVRLSAIGTLTWRDGDRILAFGHPMFQAGAVELPMVGGVIHAVLPSVALSFKLFSPTEPVGSITEDRLPAVGGHIGRVAPMIPVSVALTSPTNRDDYHFRVVKQPELTPTLVAIGLADAVYQTEGTLDEMTLALKAKVRFATDTGAGALSPRTRPAGADSVTLEHLFSGTNPAADMFNTVKDELSLIFDNRFQPVAVTGVDMTMDFTRGRELTYLVSARPDRRRVHAGETVHAVLALRDYRGREWEQPVDVPVPLTAPPGALSVFFAPRDSFFMQEMVRAPGAVAPRSFARLIEQLGETGRENELLMAGYVSTGGLTVGERELPSAPASLRSVLLGARTDEPLLATGTSLILKQPLRFDRAIVGVGRFDLEVIE